MVWEGKKNKPPCQPWMPLYGVAKSELIGRPWVCQWMGDQGVLLVLGCVAPWAGWNLAWTQPHTLRGDLKRTEYSLWLHSIVFPWEGGMGPSCLVIQNPTEAATAFKGFWTKFPILFLLVQRPGSCAWEKQRKLYFQTVQIMHFKSFQKPGDD